MGTTILTWNIERRSALQVETLRALDRFSDDGRPLSDHFGLSLSFGHVPTVRAPETPA